MVSLTGSVRHRQAHRAHRGRHAQARAPRAGRQGAGGRVRRREPRERARDDRRHRLLQRRARTAPRPRACWPPARSTTTSSPAWPSRRKGLVIGDTLAPETTLGPVNSARQRERVAGFLERRPEHAEIVTGGARARPAGLLPRADRGGRPEPGRRDDPAGDLRPGDHRAAVHRRGAGDRVGERHPLRPGVLGVDARRRPRAARLPGRCGSGACGSTTTSRSSRRCPTAASRSPATART